METNKTELLQKYLAFVFDTQEETGIATNEQIFDFFWNEIEARNAEIMKLGNMVTSIGKVLLKPNEKEVLEAKISRLESTLEADQDILKCVPLNWNEGPLGRNIYLPGFNEALEKYHAILKEKSNLK